MSRAVSIFLLAVATVTVAAAQQTFRTAVDLVHFGVVVTDKQGSPITGLTADDFEIKEAGKLQTIKFFTAGDPAAAPPLHLGFLLDASGSIGVTERANYIFRVRQLAIAVANAWTGKTEGAAHGA